MKTRFTYLLVKPAVILLAFSLYGCTGAYIPTQQNIPLFTEIGELEITASITQTDECSFEFNLFSYCTPNYTQYIQIQTAYAVTDHVAILAGGSKAFGEYNGYFAEAGTGYFTTLNFLDKPIIGITGVLGYGNGFPESDYYWHQSQGYIELIENKPYFIRAYIQPFLGYKKKNTEVIFSGRLTSFHNYYPIEVEYFQDRSYAFAEPALTIRLGLKDIKLHGQIATAFKLNKASLYYSQVNLNAGLSVRLPLKKQSETTDF